MDYLRTLGSAAVSTLVQKSGLNLPFSLGPKVTTLDGICNLYDGTKRDDGSPVSIFEYDFSDQSKKATRQLATNALRKLRTTRHPDVLKFMDAVETDVNIYIVTERTLGGLFPGSSSWATPEVKKGGWAVLKDHDPAVADAYALGLLLHVVFNPSHPPPATVHPPHPPPLASSSGAIPSLLFAPFKRLLNPNPKGRLSPKAFLEIGMADTGFFANNKLVKVCLGLDNFPLTSGAEKTLFLRSATSLKSSSSFPPEFASGRILPSLVTALEYGGASAATILPLVLQFGSNVSPEDYSNIILAPLIKLYSSPDRGTRMALLDHLPEYADRLDKKTVSDKIFPHLSTGFSDTVAVIREATTKSIIVLAPKVNEISQRISPCELKRIFIQLNDRILNNDLLRFLAKMQSDPEASIRTNTCILIGRLGPTLGYHTKKKVLVPAFTRALKDSFVHARVAGLMAFMATIDCFEADDVANKVIPNIAFAMIDKEKLVRDQAFKAVNLFVKKLEQCAATMPETVISDASDNSSNHIPEQATLATTAAGAAGSLAGWALSSLGKTLMNSDLQTTIGVGAGPAALTSAPLPAGSPGNTLSNVSFSDQTMSAAATPLSSPPLQLTSRTKGMQLGASKVPSSSTIADKWAEEVAESTSGENPWGNDDLIDVNADEDDWSAFETAPVAPPIVVVPKPITTGLGLGTIGKLDGNARRTNPSLGAPSNPSSRAPTPASSPPPQTQTGLDSTRKSLSPAPATPNSSDMSKEDRAAEMARRKEERKQRIALLKEQKKNAARA
ncbi:hypothetical protein DXG03_002196 [Asterophora parasitica]|uniref:Protein kinase domain-containing protein n=1 Tax=Asterophora parasitica TaxID=117018 RepID=A0A9P7GC24_9AGAR|nr:hypothetical protein DXG03_002196 [Asterophora parasitica]